MFNIVLYQPQIPPNTGNVARLCVGSGCHLHLIRPIAFFLDDKSMKRAGCDYWSHVNLTCHDSLDDLKKTPGINRIFYVTKHGKNTYTDVSYQSGDTFIFGSEQHGLPEELLEENRDQTIMIPMTGPIRSHNLSNAVAIVVYEALRQNK